MSPCEYYFELDVTKHELLKLDLLAKLEEEVKSDDSDQGDEMYLIKRRYKLLALLYHDEEDLGHGYYSTIVRKQITKKIDAKDAKIKKKGVQLNYEKDNDEKPSGKSSTGNLFKKNETETEEPQATARADDEEHDANEKVDQWYDFTNEKCTPIDPK